MDTFKVLFHVSDKEVWPKALKNIQNFLRDVEPRKTDIEVVANAAAVCTYYDNEKLDLMEQMSDLSFRGVKFLACRNALKANTLEEELLPPFVEVIPAGITEIVTKQGSGFAYIKP